MTDQILCEVRFQEDETRQSPGRLTGTLINFGEVASDRRERFAPGSIYFPDRGLIINEQHNRQSPILIAHPIVEARSIRVDEPFPDTTRGRDAATSMRLGILTGLSLEFYAEQEERQAGNRVVTKAFAPRAGLVDVPSYTGSQAEVRNKVWRLSKEDLLRWR